MMTIDEPSSWNLIFDFAEVGVFGRFNETLSRARLGLPEVELCETSIVSGILSDVVC